MISFLNLFYSYIGSLIESLRIPSFFITLNDIRYSVSLLHVLFGFVMISMLVSLFWKGAKG